MVTSICIHSCLTLSSQEIPQTGIHHTQQGVILETEGWVHQRYKRASFLYKDL